MIIHFKCPIANQAVWAGKAAARLAVFVRILAGISGIKGESCLFAVDGVLKMEI